MASVVGKISYDVLSLADLEALPVGTIRDFQVGPKGHGRIHLKMEKEPYGKWKVLKRHGLPSRVLAAYPSAAFDESYSTDSYTPRFSEPEQPEPVSAWHKVGPTLFTNAPKSNAPPEDSAAAMQRIIDRMPIA